MPGEGVAGLARVLSCVFSGTAVTGGRKAVAGRYAAATLGGVRGARSWVRSASRRFANARLAPAAALAAAALVSACDGEREQRLLMSARQCGMVALAENVGMRLTRYEGYPDSGTRYLVQACHSAATACTPVLTYSAAPEPLYALGSDGAIRIALFGGGVDKLHRERLTVDGVERGILVTQAGGGPERRRQMLGQRGPWRGAPDSRC